MVFPKYNKADIDCYVRKPTGPPPVDPKAVNQLWLYEEEDVTWGPTLPNER